MKTCKRCSAKYSDLEEVCPVDGTKLYSLSESSAGKEFSECSSPPHAATDPFVGKQIEKYRIIRQIGEGGMGVVYEAEHIHIGKRVALKILREDFTKKQDVVERFKQEARSASIIGHPNIIDVTDFGYTPDGRVYFVMELLEGEDLATILAKEGSIPYKRAIKIMRQVCDALSAAHKKGIVHRDMKPENIFLVDSGTEGEKVKILDFGIAKMSLPDQEGRKLTKPGVLFGTPEYMSPEQAAGKPVDHRSDIYAMGVILYEMLTGRVPFTGDTFMAVLTKHLFDKAPPVVKTATVPVPAGLQEIIDRCLEKDPGSRFGSADELALKLAAIMQNGEASTAVETRQESPRCVETQLMPRRVLEITGEEMPAPKRRLGVFVAALVIAVPVLLSGGFVALRAIQGKGIYPNWHFWKEPSGDVEDKGGGIVTTKSKGEVDGGEGASPDTDQGVEIDRGDKGDSGLGASLGSDPSKGDEGPGSGEKVTVVVKTSPGGAVVEVDGKGQLCPTTPCAFEAEKGKILLLTVTKGNRKLVRTVTPSTDPTQVEVKLEKGEDVKTKVKNGEKDKGEEDKKDKKVESIQEGELKIPSVFRDRDK